MGHWLSLHYKKDLLLDTDVAFGNTAGMKISALVLTGCATANDIEELLLNEEKDHFRDMMPTIIFPNVGFIVRP